MLIKKNADNQIEIGFRKFLLKNGIYSLINEFFKVDKRKLILLEGSIITIFLALYLQFYSLSYSSSTWIRIFFVLFTGLLAGKLYSFFLFFFFRNITSLTNEEIASKLSFIHIPVYLFWLPVFQIDFTSKLSDSKEFFYISGGVLFFSILFLVKVFLDIKKQNKWNLQKKGKILFLYLVLFLSFFLIFSHMLLNGANIQNDLNRINIKQISLNEISQDEVSKNKETIKVDYKGLEVDLGEMKYSKYIEISLTGNNNYVVVYFNKGKNLYEEIIRPEFISETVKYTINVPPEVSKVGYDTIRFYPFSGKGTHSIEYIKLLSEDKNLNFISEGELNETGSIEPELKSIKISVEEENVEKLEAQIDKCLFSSVSFTNSSDYVPAEIEFEGEFYKACIKLKSGLIKDLFLDDKWTYEIKIGDEKTFLGMKSFVIAPPLVKDYIFRWIHCNLLSGEDIICPDYTLAAFKINSKDYDLYSIEEKITDNIIFENLNEKGVIITFDQDLELKNVLEEIDKGENLNEIYSVNNDFSIKFKDIEKIINDPVLYNQIKQISKLINGFKKDELEIEEVFDVSKLGKYFAISDLTDTECEKIWNNTSFYYNPESHLLEPVGFNYVESFDSKNPSIIYFDPDSVYSRKLFKDKVFLKYYIEHLELICKKDYLENIYYKLQEKLKENIQTLKRFNDEYEFSKEELYKNQQFISIWLNPAKGLHAYLYESNGESIILDVSNILLLPIEIIGLSVDNEFLKPYEEVILPSREIDKYPEYRKISFSKNKNKIDLMNLKIQYKILGCSNVKEEEVYLWTYLSEDFISEDFMRHDPNFNEFNFISVDKKNIIIDSGKNRLSTNLIIPAGYKLICNKGCEIDLTNSAKILTYSPVEFRGTLNNPVIITSSDSTGQGLIVLKASEKSLLEYVIFDNLTSPLEKGWELTGAVTFYESPVEIKNSQFKNNKSEDGLNIIRTDCILKDCIFENTVSDAFDGDFINGDIRDIDFINCGNDGVDISGSKVDLENIRVVGAGDKGISIGENSKASGNNIDITNTKVGVAAKDLSTLTINNLKLGKVTVGLIVYQKKPEFGPAHIIVNNLSIDKELISLKYLIENRSTITLDGDLIISKRKEKERLLLRKLKLGENL